MEDKYITITQLTKYIKYKIDNDINLNQVFLKGEISNFKAHSRGHFYFTLKDENTRINAIMFSSNTKKVLFTPEDGMNVLVTGKISVYEASGTYQIYVNEMLEDGVGNLYIAYEQLKKKLEEEGLFLDKYKKPIPKIPQTIGIVTAPTGAAIRDILSTIKRRWPHVKTILLPALVQGEEAKYSIVKQIENAENFDIDTLIVGRGGGSIEDLWAFNEEIVARAIFNSKIPIISAVGHEVDFTIADFVADLRAPTPTGAAELAVPNKSDVENYLDSLMIRVKKQVLNKLNICKVDLKKITSRYIFTNPNNLYVAKEQQFDIIYEKLRTNMKLLLADSKNRLQSIKSSFIFKKPEKLLEIEKNNYLNLITRLDNISPLNTLKRGYTLTRKDNKVINSAKLVKKKDKLDIEFSDGKINVEVI
ncbi:MAG: exodeoxyribonuclease VII large subunit [Bacilli bacterium]|nr:exodeoxyribonuclease VII large subunit [Bacilli bacterium]